MNYKRTEPGCHDGVRAQLERVKGLCKRNDPYEKQNDLKVRGEK